MPPTAHSDKFDVIVIGSGFGGSIAANRLTEAGERVLLLERGPWRDSLPVRTMGIEPRAPFPYGWQGLTHLLHSVHGKQLSVRLNKAGLYEFFSFNGIGVLVTSGVGGGSTAYGGLLQPPRDPSYWQGHHPALDTARIEAFYSKIISDMGGERLSREHVVPQSVWTHFPESAVGKVHASELQPHMGMLLPRSSDDAGRLVTDAHGIERRYCNFDGDGFLGSRGGAKASVDFIYLAPALRQGLTVRDLCQVERIRPARAIDGGGYLIQFNDLRQHSGNVVQAKRIVLAAGNLNTQRLLFASAQQPEGLVAMPALGKRFGGNGDLVAIWNKGPGLLPSFCSPPSQGAFTVDGHSNADYGIGGFAGLDSLPLPGFIKRMLARRFFMYGIGGDSGNGSVSIERGRLRARYDSAAETSYLGMREAFSTLGKESGGPIWTLNTPVTVHPWGGAGLGADAQHGVVDHRGEVFGNPGLFVADGAALPAAPGGPPSLAIAAWAHHVAEGMA